MAGILKLISMTLDGSEGSSPTDPKFIYKGLQKMDHEMCGYHYFTITYYYACIIMYHIVVTSAICEVDVNSKVSSGVAKHGIDVIGKILRTCKEDIWGNYSGYSRVIIL